MAFSQNDNRWRLLALGLVAATSIGNYGCYITAMANVAAEMGFDVTPLQINNQLISRGLYIDGNLVGDNYLELLYPQLVFEGTENYGGPANLDFIAQAADPNIEIIIGINALNTLGADMHFCRVVQVSGNNVLIDDSWDGRQKWLNSTYGDSRTVILKAVKYVKKQVKEIKKVNYITEGQIRVLWRQKTGEDPHPDAIKTYVGKFTWEKTEADLLASDAYKRKIRLAAEGKLDMSQFADYNIRSKSGPAYPGQPTADAKLKMQTARDALNAAL